MWACRYQIAATCPKYTLLTEQSSQESRKYSHKYIYGICFLNLLSKATYNHSFTHSTTQVASQLIMRLAQGYLDTQRGAAGD